MTATEWFANDKSYAVGCDVYRAHPNANEQVLRMLARGESKGNYAALVFELRRIKKTELAPAPRLKPRPKPISETKEATASVIADEIAMKGIKTESVQKRYGGIKYAALPPELKVRYREAVDLFYQKCDLKFVLNSLPAKAESDALKLVLQIDDLDDRGQTIWKELDHWQQYKSALPTAPTAFECLSAEQAYLKRSNAKSQITKLRARIDSFYDKLSAATDTHEKTLLENQITRSEKRMHQHELNLHFFNSKL